jgi:hypothetical protein
MSISITHLSAKHPRAAYYTPEMIADIFGVKARDVQQHCRRMFPDWRGHWRFATNDSDTDWLLSVNDLEFLLDYLAQQKQRRIFLKK